GDECLRTEREPGELVMLATQRIEFGESPTHQSVLDRVILGSWPHQFLIEPRTLGGEPFSLGLELVALTQLRLRLTLGLGRTSQLHMKSLPLRVEFLRLSRGIAQLLITLAQVTPTHLDVFHLAAEEIEQLREVRAEGTAACRTDPFRTMLFKQVPLILQLLV